MKPKFKMGQKAFIVRKQLPQGTIYEYENEGFWAVITLSHAIGGLFTHRLFSIKNKI